MNMNDLISDENYLMRNEIEMGMKEPIFPSIWEDICDSPWTVKGVDLGRDDHYGISIDNKTIKEIVEEAVKELLKDEEVANKPIRIEKYHMKHK